jgi:putative phosphonate catabolism associated alcohol dehydrogenase
VVVDLSQWKTEVSTSYVFDKPGQPFGRVEFDTPVAGADEILVRLDCCTICRSDLHTWMGRRPGHPPMMLGHEMAGVIETFGTKAPREDHSGAALAIGDRVVCCVYTSCSACTMCQHQLPQKCVELYKYGHEQVTPTQPIGGGTGTHLLLRPGSALFKIPNAVPAELAALATCAGATAASVLRSAGTLHKQRVLVLGAGALGLFAIAMAKRAGATVYAADPLSDNRERALCFGAIAVCAPADVSRMIGVPGVDVALELAGPAESVQRAMDSARIGGTVILAGSVMPVAGFAMNPEQIVRRCLTIRGVHNYHPNDLQFALEAIAEDIPMYRELIGDSFPLEQIDDAFDHAECTPGVRTVLRCDVPETSADEERARRTLN